MVLKFFVVVNRRLQPNLLLCIIVLTVLQAFIVMYLCLSQCKINYFTTYPLGQQLRSQIIKAQGVEGWPFALRSNSGLPAGIPFPLLKIEDLQESATSLSFLCECPVNYMHMNIFLKISKPELARWISYYHVVYLFETLLNLISGELYVSDTGITLDIWSICSSSWNISLDGKWCWIHNCVLGFSRQINQLLMF